MALHDKDSIREDLLDDVFAFSNLSTALPKYRILEKVQNPCHAYQLARNELMLDRNPKQNLTTFCQTWVEDEIRALMDQSIGKNMIDKDEYP